MQSGFYYQRDPSPYPPILHTTSSLGNLVDRFVQYFRMTEIYQWGSMFIFWHDGIYMTRVRKRLSALKCTVINLMLVRMCHECETPHGAKLCHCSQAHAILRRCHYNCSQSTAISCFSKNYDNCDWCICMHIVMYINAIGFFFNILWGFLEFFFLHMCFNLHLCVTTVLQNVRVCVCVCVASSREY